MPSEHIGAIAESARTGNCELAGRAFAGSQVLGTAIVATWTCASSRWTRKSGIYWRSQFRNPMGAKNYAYICLRTTKSNRATSREFPINSGSIALLDCYTDGQYFKSYGYLLELRLAFQSGCFLRPLVCALQNESDRWTILGKVLNGELDVDSWMRCLGRSRYEKFRHQCGSTEPRHTTG